VTGLRQTADAVADGIGALHALTLGPGDELEGPDDVADVLASLALAMSRIPRLLGQLAAFLEVEHVKETVTAGGQPGAGEEPVRAVSDALHRAGLDAETMAVTLEAAQRACAELTAAPRGGRRISGAAPPLRDGSGRGRPRSR